MKTLVIVVSMVFGSCVYASAYHAVEGSVSDNILTIVQDDKQVKDEYKTVKVEELNLKVQEAIKVYQKTNDVKLLEYDKAKKMTRATLVSKADKKGKVVLINEEGVEVKEPAKTKMK